MCENQSWSIDKRLTYYVLTMIWFAGNIIKSLYISHIIESWSLHKWAVSSQMGDSIF